MGRVTGRPRLLFLCQTLPYPPDGGVWIRSYHVLRLLSRAFDVTALCFERAATSNAGSAEAIATARRILGRFAAVDVFRIPQRHSGTRFAWDHSRSLLSGRPYTAYLYDSTEFRSRLTSLLDVHAFDLVHMDSLDLAGYLPACAGTPVVCVHHDVEWEQLDRRAAIESSAWRSAYLRHQARLTQQMARRCADRVTLHVAVSEPDRAALRRVMPAACIAVVPNGVDLDEFHPAAADGGRGVAFAGGTNWFPNLDALEHFCSDIRPHLHRLAGQVPARWIGNATPRQQQHYRECFGVELTGYVDDVRPHLRDAACHIVPLRAGSGTRLKILNSWAMGKPVVSTSVGCEGLDAVDGHNILIEDNPARFAAAVAAVLRDPALRRRLGSGGRATAERLYSWEVVGRGMIDCYSEIAHAGHHAGRVAAAARG